MVVVGDYVMNVKTMMADIASRRSSIIASAFEYVEGLRAPAMQANQRDLSPSSGSTFSAPRHGRAQSPARQLNGAAASSPALSSASLLKPPSHSAHRAAQSRAAGSVIGSSHAVASVHSVTPADVEQALAELLDDREQDGRSVKSAMQTLEDRLEEALSGM